MKHRAQIRNGASARALLLGGAILAFLLYSGLAVWVYWKSRSDDVDPTLLNELKRAALKRAHKDGGQKPKTVEKVPPLAMSDWPQWRGPRRDGIWRGTGIRTQWPAADALKKLTLWKQNTGPGYASMAVADGRVYTIFQEEDNEVVVCWHAENGKELWRHRYPSKLEERTYRYGPGPRSTPTVDGKRVYTVGATGIMHCLSTTGDVIWMSDLIDVFAGRVPTWGVSFSPLVAGNLVYVVPGNSAGACVAALDKKTGSVVWKSLDHEPAYSSPILANLAGREQIVLFTAYGMAGLTPDNGRLLWQYPWKTSYDANVATPIVAGDYVFLSSGYGRGCAVIKVEKQGDELYRARLVYRKTQRKNSIMNHFSTSVLYKEHIYGFSDDGLKCMEFRTGKIVWKLPSRLRRLFGKGSLIVADDHLILLGDRGLLGIAEATPKQIKLKSKIQLTVERCWSLPVVARGLLYVRDQDHIWCLDLRRK